MAIEFITADDQDGFESNTDDTDVFIKAGVVLGSQSYALSLYATAHACHGLSESRFVAARY